VFTALVRAEDSNGDIDTLKVIEPATIGSVGVAALTTSSVEPTVVVSESRTTLKIRGSGFLPGTRVTLTRPIHEGEGDGLAAA
jgi:hypothetical protein